MGILDPCCLATQQSNDAQPLRTGTTTLPAGLDASTSLTAAYVAVWGEQEKGAQIAVRLTAISPAGIRGVPYDVVGVVKASASAGELFEPDTTGDMVLAA